MVVWAKEITSERNPLQIPAMSAHEQFAEDLALHALGALRGEDKRALEQHLAGCSACRSELTELQSDAALLALTATGPAPSVRVREELLRATAPEPRAVQVITRRRPWAFAFAFSAAAALALIAAFLWNENRALKGTLADANRNYSQQQDQLTQAQDLIDTLTSQQSRRVTLVAAKSVPQPQGKIFYLPGKAHLVFLASDMAQLPAGRVYELWLIPVTGAPIPAGLFKADAHGSGSIVNPPLQAGVEAKAFAITVEPEGGSPAPTSQIIMLGAGE
jgi:anti-sigma-K factor RskA